jgi:hypothetical protein
MAHPDFDAIFNDLHPLWSVLYEVSRPRRIHL